MPEFKPPTPPISSPTTDAITTANNLTTYQVMVRPWAAALLAEIHHSGRGELGTHLHPWNTPPLHEASAPENTSLRTLSAAVRRANHEASPK